MCVLVGLLNGIFALLYLDYSPEGGGFLAEWIPGGFIYVWTIALIVMTPPYIIAGLGLYRLKTWARPAAMIILTCGLAALPLGTALGAYGLSLLMSDEVDELFSPRFHK